MWGKDNKVVFIGIAIGIVFILVLLWLRPNPPPEFPPDEPIPTIDITEVATPSASIAPTEITGQPIDLDPTGMGGGK